MYLMILVLFWTDVVYWITLQYFVGQYEMQICIFILDAFQWSHCLRQQYEFDILLDMTTVNLWYNLQHMDFADEDIV